MKLLYAFAAIFLSTPTMGAQTARTPVSALPAKQAAATGTAPKAPAFTDAQKAAYFKAKADLDEARLAIQQATQTLKTKAADFDTIIGEMQKNTCGEKFSATLDTGGMPICVANDGPKKETK